MCVFCIIISGLPKISTFDGVSVVYSKLPFTSKFRFTIFDLFLSSYLSFRRAVILGIKIIGWFQTIPTKIPASLSTEHACTLLVPSVKVDYDGSRILR